MKHLYAVVVTNLGTAETFAVRAFAPSEAVARILAAGNVRHFQQVEVVRLDKELSEEEDQATAREAKA